MPSPDNRISTVYIYNIADMIVHSRVKLHNFVGNFLDKQFFKILEAVFIEEIIGFYFNLIFLVITRGGFTAPGLLFVHRGISFKTCKFRSIDSF